MSSTITALYTQLPNNGLLVLKETNLLFKMMVDLDVLQENVGSRMIALAIELSNIGLFASKETSLLFKMMRDLEVLLENVTP